MIVDKRKLYGISIFVCCLCTARVFGCADFLAEVFDSLTSKLECLFDLNTPTIEAEGPINDELVTECLEKGQEMSRAARKRGNDLVKSGIKLASSSQAISHFFSSKLPPDMVKASQTSQNLLAATKLMQMKLCSTSNITPNTFMSFLEHQVIQLQDTSYCKPPRVVCDRSPYRSIDGTCNNLKHPTWGRRGAPVTRLAPARYADGIHAMPVARSGRDLPSARLLSSRLFANRGIASRVLTYLNMQWGQYITHDMMHHVMEGTDEGAIQCCLGDGNDILPTEWQHDKCMPIPVPADDPFYRYYGVRCLNFVRSITTHRDDCSLGPAEQMNTVTSFLDGSPVYSPDPKVAYKLRSKKGGKLREVTRSHCVKGFLPSVDDKAAVCDLRNMSEPCYLAGDIRVNQSPPLAVLQTLLMREHNRVADVLSSLNPLWSDERIYQEARRVVIAEIQHITYQEWLPLNFGENYLRYYRITPGTLFSRDYDEEANPGVINAFTAAAFRFLHTIIPDTVTTCPATYHAAYLHRLSDHYMNPGLLESSSESFDDLVRGILAQYAGESDPFYSGEVSNLLFKSRNQWGLDLIAMDIQRGRDHGIASYNEFRQICGLRRASTFQDLAGEISQDRINALASLYECVDDIDLYVGGALEQDVPGSILGTTFQCIVAEQFYRTRIGDRFFYDNCEMAHSFTSEQLKEIKKASMARLICDNTEGVAYVQRKAFELESAYNPKYSCQDYSAIPYVDLSAWRHSVLEIFD